jgi:hypothetical protein
VSSEAVLLPAGAPLWRRQALAAMRDELRKSFSLRTLWLFLFAFAPPFVITMHALNDRGCRVAEETIVLGVIVQIFYTRFGLLFASLGLSMRLLRGLVAEKTLHYPFLAPVRREVLVFGKYLAAVLTVFLVFGAGITASFLLMYGHFPAGRDYLMNGGGLSHLPAYWLVAALATFGYTAVFLAFSLIFKNPGIPFVIVLLWEGINGVLPVWLKRFSVTFYLKPLFPVELPVEGISGLFTVVAEPTPAWLAISGLLAFSALVMAFVCWRVRRLEVSYSTD